MIRQILITCFVVFCWLTPCVAAPVDAALAAELCQAQSLDRMKDGVFVIPETAMNDYFTAAIQDHPKIQEAHINVLEKNRLRIRVKVEGEDPVQLTCAIRELHYDKDRASLELDIVRKEIIGRPITSWMMNQVSWGFIVDIFGNPLNKTDVQSKVRGNHLSIDLKPLTAELFHGSVGARLGDLLVISQATTEPGLLYLHTNLGLGLLMP
ncbi:MAG TPA: hypothetical protein VN611_11990 [Patescibacteria group bacterium]|nr:hypothetical protein [Patescibacteria group bacterium]